MTKNTALSSIILAIGLVISAIILSFGLLHIKSNNRFVTVRGLDEQYTKANLVVWHLNFKAIGKDLETTQINLDQQKKLITEFLKSAGFTQDEFSQQLINVTDKRANQYDNRFIEERYILSTSIKLRSTKVDLAAQAQQKLSKLIKSGVTLSDNGYCSNSPNYLFTKLNDIKIDMLAKATKNARDAAKQFADNADASVGSIRQATQGYFSISAQDSVENCGEKASLMKKVRVVTTVDFFLE